MCQYANAIAFFHWHIIPLGYYLSFTLLHVSFKDTVRLKTNLSTVVERFGVCQELFDITICQYFQGVRVDDLFHCF